MKNILKMIIVLTIIGLISGGVLALVYQWALPKILDKQAQETKAAIFKVLPETESYKKVAKDDLTYFECFNKKGNRIGTAILCKGNGYQGGIKMMVGINADFSKFTGMTVLEQVETPGLGAKIAEEKFRSQFKDLNTDKIREVDAITGATISSRAVINIIDKTVKEWLKIK